MTLMAVAVVLAAIAVIAPSSAVPIGNHDITFDSHTFDGTYSTWTYRVTSGSDPSLSHWVLTWCNEGALIGCSEYCDYVTDDPTTGLTGIKFDKGYDDGDSRFVSFTLLGDFHEGLVEVGTKAGGQIDFGYVTGPVKCNEPIPEFPAVALPIATMLGLMFFFYHRSQRRKG